MDLFAEGHENLQPVLNNEIHNQYFIKFAAEKVLRKIF